MTDADLHALAVDAGAMVLGDPETVTGVKQQYLFDLSQLNALRALLAPPIPPCPVPLPSPA